VGNEKLASDLARMVGVVVPLVEFDRIEGKDGLWAVSKAHGETSIDATMLREQIKEHFKAPEVQESFRAASGLVAFYAWIGTTDLKDDHLCLAARAAGGYEVVGVDFEMSFCWHEIDGGQVESPGIAPAMLTNIDKRAVQATVVAIESAADQQIREMVGSLPETVANEAEKTRLADGLIGRKKKVRDRMRALGWLD